jgi:DNA-binding XRE family transcriptional regulator
MKPTMSESTKCSGGAALAAFRERHGLPRTKAAKQLGVSHVVMRAWELGHCQPRESRWKEIRIWSKGELPESIWASRPSRSVRPFDAPDKKKRGRAA